MAFWGCGSQPRLHSSAERPQSSADAWAPLHLIGFGWSLGIRTSPALSLDSRVHWLGPAMLRNKVCTRHNRLKWHLNSTWPSQAFLPTWFQEIQKGRCWNKGPEARMTVRFPFQRKLGLHLGLHAPECCSSHHWFLFSGEKKTVPTNRKIAHANG